jgi:hypothetical protein
VIDANGEPSGERGEGGRERLADCDVSPLVSMRCALRDAHGERRRTSMIRKLRSGKFRLYSRKKNPRTGRRRNLGTFSSREAAKRHERAVQFFKRGG